MRKLLAVLLLALLVGCVSQPAAEENVTKKVVEDTVLNAPELTPSGYVKDGNTTITAKFDEPVVLTAFTINNVTQNVTRKDEKTYTVEKSFDDGTYKIIVSAEDTAGNPVTKEVSLTVDTVVPTVTVDPENNEQVSDSDVEITLLFSEEVTIIESKINSNALALSSSDNKEFTVTKNLGDGKQSLYVKAKDGAGNEVVSDTDFTVSVGQKDTSPPPQVSGVTATDTGKGGEVKLAWKAVDVNDFKEYRVYKSVDDVTSVMGKTAAYKIKAKATTAWTISGLTTDTRYCFAVTAVDNSDNEDYDVLASCVTPTESDKTPPSIDDYFPSDTVTATRTPLIKVVTNEAAGCKYALSNESGRYYVWSNLSYSFSRNSDKTEHTKTHPVALDNTTYHVYVLCEDMEDNMMEDVYDYNFDVLYDPPLDTTPPGITIDNPSNTTYTSASVSLNITTDESASWCKYSLNGGANLSMSGSATTWYKSVSPGDGAHQIEFFCADSESNVGTSGEYFTIDTIPPSKVTSISLDSKTNVSINVTWTYSEPSDFDEYWVYIETNTTSGNATALFKEAAITDKYYDFTGLTNVTTYYFLVVAVDNAGNKHLTGLTEKSWATNA